jgi:putative holliday junction resolvase
MRTLGLDLGTKTLGLAISDRSNTITSPLKTLRYDGENFNYLLDELAKIINEYQVQTLVLGLPKNMNNSLGFASERSMNFKKMLDERFATNTILVDERLSTVEAENMLINNDMRRNKRKKVIDSVAAMIILDTYLRRENNNGKQNQ